MGYKRKKPPQQSGLVENKIISLCLLYCNEKYDSLGQKFIHFPAVRQMRNYSYLTFTHEATLANG